MDFDEEFKDVQKRMDRIIRDLFSNRFLHMPGEPWSPPMDVYETETDLVIILELAGAVPEDLTLSFERGVLIIRGKRELSADLSHTKCHQMEIDSGSFQKQIYIPFAVDKDRATSQYKGGLLKITLPKAARMPKKSIEISLE